MGSRWVHGGIYPLKKLIPECDRGSCHTGGGGGGGGGGEIMGVISRLQLVVFDFARRNPCCDLQNEDKEFRFFLV